MKKVLLTLGLVAGIVTNAQIALISGDNKTFKVTRLNFDSVEVKHMEMGEVKSIDTMLLSDFITMTGGYNTISGNLKNPVPVAPTIEQPKHKHTLTNEHKEFIGYMSFAAATYGFYKFLMWVASPPKTQSTPIYYSGGQCTAIAASTGLRCKHSAQPGRNRCWQH